MEMTLNVMNAVAGARHAAGPSISPTSADPLGFFLHPNNFQGYRKCEKEKKLSSERDQCEGC